MNGAPDPTQSAPAGRLIAHQRWRQLLFLHWPVPTEVLRPLVPATLQLDGYEGVAYVGLIPFWLDGLRPVGVPDALALRFLETNVRTYVVHERAGPGVYFFSLDAGSRLAVLGARLGFGLPYHLARARLALQGDVYGYQMERFGGYKPRIEAAYTVGEPRGTAEPGSLAHFLIERYRLYVQRGQVLQKLEVRHSPYPLHDVTLHRVNDRMIAAAGLPEPVGAPLTHYSPGVDVETYAPEVVSDRG